MRKIFREKNLLASLLVLVMLLCSFPAVYAEEALPEIAEEVAVEALPESAEEVLPEAAPEAVVTEEEPAAEPEEIPEEAPAEAPEAVEIPEGAPAAEPEEIPEKVPAAEPEEIPEETPVAEPEEIPEEVPAAEPEEVSEEIPEEAPAAEPEPEAIPEEAPVAAPEDAWEDVQEAEPAEEDLFDDDLFVELDEDDAGSVSEELLNEFNNPETYEAADAGVSVEIEMKTSEIRFGEEVTLAAKVSGVNMNHRIVWEANDGDGRGWFTVGSGSEYTFTVTPDIVEREYRAVLFSVD